MSPPRERTRRPTAAVGSVVVHLALVGGLWSAQAVHRNEFLLAGGRGSLELQASVAAPPPTETPIVERLLPMEVRVEPDHVHVDRQILWTAPPIEPPKPEVPEAELSHEHPHRHEPHMLEPPPTTAAMNVPIVATSTATDASAATATGHDETLPALADNPPPHYPAEAHRTGIEGTVVLRVGVRSDGAVEFVDVAQSSGHRALDDAAVEAVRRWRFTPGRRDGRTAPFVLRLPIVFRL